MNFSGPLLKLLIKREDHLFNSSPFMGTHEPNKLTCSQLCGLIAQLVRALDRHRSGHGFECRWRHLHFSGALRDNCLNYLSSARIICSSHKKEYKTHWCYETGPMTSQSKLEEVSLSTQSTSMSVVSREFKNESKTKRKNGKF